MKFLKKTSIDFIGMKKYAFGLSVVLIIIGVVSIIVRGGLNLGIDFIGGTLTQMKIQPMPAIEEVRKTLIENGLKDAQIQHFPKENEIIVRVKKGEVQLVEEIRLEILPQASGETLVQAVTAQIATQTPRMGGVESKFYEMFSKKFPQTRIEVTRAEMVGPAVGKKLLNQAIKALFAGVILIMVYIGWRFEFKYSAPAVLALLHDTFITIGILTLLNKEITVTIVAAILTLIGYSINDTIVVYDRIREKKRLFAKDELAKVMNIAINETLSRTIITSITTGLVLLSIFFAGGEVLHNFAFTLLFGIIIGTYSSIFVASPLVYELEKGVRS
ncbi:protein-export membrane protein SecF [Candidatus Desantisbacteria bacterium CG1_02_38_46]|uniref:Protein-export membrane protein SecF n=2 Tax=unclassified Candidatus Desantisiibacteriota TaxID=3106372 RepID=A0A2H9PCD7_9BACT|nr:MAG: protein-export membrane protein SecF [Candidatus Desantisbacteria bacterium CG1_02_38_46]PIZ16874.1 MAG: protein translocase subunit SecF [Candidatus Desantisbacteria bacterium CG_4_10_14_0_8_um_filter_39_17]